MQRLPQVPEPVRVASRVVGLVRSKETLIKNLLGKKQTTVENPIPKKAVITIKVMTEDLSPDTRLPFNMDRVILNTVPKEISINPETRLVAIATMGRNLPHYHYTGAEDTLEMELDWYCMTEDFDQVVRSCRWLEAMSKADGYYARIPRIKLIWGDGGVLFPEEKYQWVIKSAPYKFSRFNLGYYLTEDRKPKDPTLLQYVRKGMEDPLGYLTKRNTNPVKAVIRSDQNWVDTKLFPYQAYQTLTLARVSDHNLKYHEILTSFKDSFKGRELPASSALGTQA